MTKKNTLIDGTWVFNDKVAENFDQHVYQSVPEYSSFQSYVASISEWFLKENSLIYDLGCSTGQTCHEIQKLNIKNKNIKIVGLDENSKMIEIASKKNKNYKENFNLKFYQSDILTYDYEEADLFILFLVLPFLGFNDKELMLNKIYQKLKPGGAVLIVEKLRTSSAQFEDLFFQLYFEFKLSQGLSEIDILDKARSLRSAMTILNLKEEINLFQSCGFECVEIFKKSLNFTGFIINK